MNRRAFASFLMFFSVVALVPSGIMLHLTSPDGSERTRELLMCVHNVAGIIFVISASVHFAFNYRSMVSFVRSKADIRFHPRREVTLAATVVVVLITLVALHVFIHG
jgi:hypothetical protein